MASVSFGECRGTNLVALPCLERELRDFEVMHQKNTVSSFNFETLQLTFWVVQSGGVGLGAFHEPCRGHWCPVWLNRRDTYFANICGRYLEDTCIELELGEVDKNGPHI